MDKSLNEKLKRMNDMATEIENELIFYKKNPEKVVEQALHKLTEKHVEECLIISAIIAIKKAENSIDEVTYNNGKLRGYLHCLFQLEIIDWIDEKALYEWFSNQDRNLSGSNE